MKIPFLSVPDKALESTTQDQLPVADITQNIIVYKNGGAALVLESTSLNFGLLSDIEQEAVIAGYAGLLNSFTFPVQIVVRSERKDISSYIKYLNEAQKKVQNQKLLNIMIDYKKFITEAIRKKNVLSKKFYIIIPFTQYELGVAKSMVAVAKTKGPLPFPKKYVVNKAKMTLYPKRDHLIRQAGRLGITFRQLKTEELIKVFYNIYNPEPPPKKEEYEFLNE
jgi:hypothetical protein